VSTTTRAAELATAFAAVNDEIEAAAEGCDEAMWMRLSAGEGWTVAAVIHHIAIVQRAFAGMVRKLASGETYSPNLSMDSIHAENARHAEVFARAGKMESLDILRSSRDDILAMIGRRSDEELDRTAGTFGGNDLTVGLVIEYVVIGHPRKHMESIRATLAS
jgi:hypothetical protein